MLKRILSAVILLFVFMPLSSCFEDTKDFLGGGSWGFNGIQKEAVLSLKEYWDENVQHDATSEHSFALVTEGLRVILRNYYQKTSINIDNLIQSAKDETENYIIRDKHHKIKEKLNAGDATTYLLTGMAKYMDSSSWYMTTDEYNKHLEYNKFTNVLGVGITLAPRRSGYGISEIWSQSPADAYKNDLSNFTISSINGRDTRNLRLIQILTILRNGQHGEYLLLKNSQNRQVTLTKELMIRKDVTFTTTKRDNTLRIHIQRIIPGVARKIKKEILNYVNNSLWSRSHKFRIFINLKGATDNNWSETFKIISLFADKPIQVLFDGIGAKNDKTVEILNVSNLYPKTTKVTADIDPYTSDSARAIFKTLVQKTRVIPINRKVLKILPDVRIHSDIHIYSGGGTMHLTTQYYTILGY